MGKINVVVKEPGKDPERMRVENRLETFQQLVAGYIETVSITKDVLAIVNEEGLILGLPESGVCGLYGTVVFVRPKGDEFASLLKLDEHTLCQLLEGI